MTVEAKARQRRAVASLPVIKQRAARNLALDAPVGNEMAKARTALAKLDDELETYQAALSVVAAEQAAHEAAMVAQARQEARDYVVSTTRELEDRVREIVLPLVADAVAARAEAAAIGADTGDFLGPFGEVVLGDGRTIESSLQTWLNGQEANRGRKAQAEARRAEAAERRKRWGIRILRPYGNYGLNDEPVMESLELAAANDAATWLFASDENQTAEARARKQIAEIELKNRGFNHDVAGHAFVTDSIGASYINDGRETIESHSGKAPGWNN